MQESTWNIGGELLTDAELISVLVSGRKPRIVSTFFYETCYPLFASTYNRYYTDCESVTEFINEIYAYLLYEKKEERTPDRSNCKLARFGFRCTLTTWLKIVAENYCRNLFAKKMDISENISPDSDRFEVDDHSLETDITSINMSDVWAVLRLMPNERYRKLIQYRYLEEHTNEETAALLDMNMANYYNKHKLAKAQFCEALRKEGLI